MSALFDSLGAFVSSQNPLITCSDCSLVEFLFAALRNTSDSCMALRQIQIAASSCEAASLGQIKNKLLFGAKSDGALCSQSRALSFAFA